MREFGSEFPAVIMPDGYLKNLNRFGDMVWLRSGRESLYYVALGIKKRNVPVILFPAYCCHSMSDPFRKAGWDIVYYRINEDLTVDTGYLEILLRRHTPDALLTMNYYGSSPTGKAVALAKNHNPECVCIEDFSHCTFCFEDIFNPQVDFYVTSVRKSVGITDGAIVIGKYSLDKSVINTEFTGFTRNRKTAQLQKARYAFTGSEAEKQEFLSILRGEERGLDAFDGVHSVSEDGRAMMEEVNGGEIRHARACNMRHMSDLLSGKVDMLPGLERCLDGAPFSVPILVQNRDEVQVRLAKQGVYAPVLWPVCDEARAVCPVSAYVSDHMLSIPIDQRYNKDDIDDIARIVISTVS